MPNEPLVKSAAEQVANRLASDLKNATWVETLPGLKVLAKRYRVSHQTVDAAMSFLEQWGWLEPAQPRKARRIIQRTNVEKSTVRNVLILLPEGAVNADSTVQFLNHLALLWAKFYEGSSIVAVKNRSAQAAEAELDRLIQVHSADAIVLYNLSLHWARSALERLPTYFCGGALPPEALAKALINGYSMCTHAEVSKTYKLLRSLGHSRILFVYTPSGSGNRDMVLALSESTNTKDDLVGLPEDYCIQVESDDPAVWQRMWKREITRLKPTAVIALPACAVSSLYAYCYKSGLKIPNDISIVSLEHAMVLEYLYPKPQMLKYDFDGHLRHFESWLEKDLMNIGFKISLVTWDDAAASIAKVNF